MLISTQARACVVRALSALAIAVAVGAPSSLDARELNPIEGAYELTLADIVLPQFQAGDVTFTACSNCSRIRLPTTADTAFRIDGARLALAPFLEATAALRSRGAAPSTLVTVFYALDGERATRIEILTR
jgi:hypothetical protein